MSVKVKSATLLSIEEAERFLTKEERKYNCWWWLRSPGYHQNLAVFVFSDGLVFFHGRYVSHCSGCVRPALKISIESSDLKIGDVFDFGSKKFKIISNHLAFCLDDIGKSLFREDWLTSDANDYTHSDIKKFVNNWFKDAKKEEQN